MDAVSQTILDVAFSKERPPIALNLVHPRPVEWNDVILPVGEEVRRQRGLEGSSLRVVSFQEWFSLVEDRAKSASEDDVKKIVSFWHFLMQKTGHRSLIAAIVNLARNKTTTVLP